MSVSEVSFSTKWGSSESTSLLPVVHRLDSQSWHHMLVEFVVGSGPCFKSFFFSAHPGFTFSEDFQILILFDRGYYTAARRYEFYFRVVKTIFYERAQRVSKILFLTRENKIHIFKPPCNFLFII